MPDKVKSQGSRSCAGTYQSSRSEWDVLQGDDAALPLIEAIKSDDPTVLRDMLSQAQWYQVAIDEPLTIYSTSSGNKREASALPLSNLARLLIFAGTDGRPEATKTLYDFAKEQAIDPASVSTRWSVEATIKSHSLAAVEAMITADPETLSTAIRHDTFPLELAMKEPTNDMVLLMLRHGADPSPKQNLSRKTWPRSIIAWAAARQDSAILKAMLERKCPVAQSGALHRAAQEGRLDNMRILLEHKADPNERLDKDMFAYDQARLLSSWTPLHFAARHGQREAMELLESHGARTDIKDAEKRTPVEVMQVHGKCD